MWIKSVDVRDFASDVMVNHKHGYHSYKIFYKL